MHGMVFIMDYYSMSDRAILREIGRRLKRKRLDRNMTQQTLADRAGNLSPYLSDQIPSGEKVYLPIIIRNR